MRNHALAPKPVTLKRFPAICRTLGANALALVFLKWPGHSPPVHSWFTGPWRRPNRRGHSIIACSCVDISCRRWNVGGTHAELPANGCLVEASSDVNFAEQGQNGVAGQTKDLRSARDEQMPPWRLRQRLLGRIFPAEPFRAPFAPIQSRWDCRGSGGKSQNQFGSVVVLSASPRVLLPAGSLFNSLASGAAMAPRVG